MADFDQEREDELAQLLREVRELRQTVEELKANQLPASAAYNVMVRSDPTVYTDYPVAVQLPVHMAPPVYSVLAQSAVPPAYSVYAQPAAAPAAYSVLAHPAAAPAAYSVVARSSMAPSYSVAVRSTTHEPETSPVTDE